MAKFHLERGRKYRILGVREVKHDCTVHEDGVKVVEVEKVPLDAALDKKLAIEGSTITIELPKCRNLGCQHLNLCFPPGVESRDKFTVMSCGGGIDCAAGEERVSVMLE